MSKNRAEKPLVAIACGGTGGHLFPGIAVADKLVMRGADVLLLISPKEVDQQAVKSAIGMEVAVLPAVGLTRGRVLQFVRGFTGSYRAAVKAPRASMIWLCARCRSCWAKCRTCKFCI